METARITVEEALALSVLRRGLPDVVAGRDQLGRTIRWVHAGEVSNIASMLTGGELLLTTGMGIGRRATEQRRFVAELAERGIAALVIELGDPLPQLPPALVRAAEEAGLPLVALTREVKFVKVTEEIHTAIVNAQYALLRRGDDFHRELTELVVEGGGIPEVLDRLGRLLANPVYLEDGDGRLLLHAGPGDGDVDPLEAWQASRRGSTGRAPWRAGLSEPVSTGPRTRPGRLLVLPVAGPLDELAGVALRRAADIVALSLLRTRQEEELTARERGNFLGELVDGRLSGEAAGRLAESLGFVAATGLLLPIAAETDAAAGAAVWSVVLRDVQGDLAARNLPALVGTRPRAGGLLAVVALREADQRASVADAAAAAVRAAVERGLGAGDVRVAVGCPIGWAGAGDSLRLAVETTRAVASLPPAPWHDVGDRELQRLLWRWRDDEELAGFVARRLGPLVENDRRRRHELLPTLEALCANGWHKAETARALRLNRQALYDRIARIEALLGVDLSDPEQALTLHLAVRARPYVV